MINADALPSVEEYFMGIAIAVRQRANCVGQRVGAVLMRDNRVLATGYNGTPQDMVNCLDGGCVRCANRNREFASGTSYDICICVHSEQNALLSAARFGIPVEGAVLFSTTRPCLGCTKELLQAEVSAVWYIHDWAHPDERYGEQYRNIQGRFPKGIRCLPVSDPRADWARAGRTTPGATGHSLVPGN